MTHLLKDLRASLSSNNPAKMQYRLLQALYWQQENWMTVWALEDVLYGDVDDGGAGLSDNVIRIAIMKMREKLPPGWTIENMRGHYRYRLHYENPKPKELSDHISPQSYNQAG
jgi:DNA-binding response OmpR family regulator